MKRTIAAALLGALVGWLAAASPAGACETEATPLGLTLVEPLPRKLPQGGAVALTARVVGVDVPAELAAMPEFLVTRDDVEVAGTLTTVTIASGLDASGLRVYELLQVWHPKAPLSVGDTLVATWTDRWLSAQRWMISVIDEPVGVKLPTITATGRSVRVDAGERVCCEILADSCDRTSLCLPTRARDVPVISLGGARLSGEAPQGWLWVARLDAQGEPGPPLARVHDPYALGDRPAWAGWDVDVVFPADAEPPYCVVVGVTSLVDRTTQRSDPLCVDADAVGPLGVVELEPDLPAHAIDQSRECVSDPVYEADGGPYPPPASGCAVAPRPALSALLLLALLRRRRPA